MRYRTGRRNGHTVYLQLGDDPGEKDLFVGSAVSVPLAALLVAHANRGLEAERSADDRVRE